MKITSIVLAQKFQTDWFKITFLRNVQTAVGLGSKARFGGMGLAQVNPFGPCCFYQWINN